MTNVEQIKQLSKQLNQLACTDRKRHYWTHTRKGGNGMLSSILCFKLYCTCRTGWTWKGVEPSAEGIEGCEEFLCALFCPRRHHVTQAKDLRWHLFKQLKPDQGVDKLPTTHGGSTQSGRSGIMSHLSNSDMVQQALPSSVYL